MGYDDGTNFGLSHLVSCHMIILMIKRPYRNSSSKCILIAKKRNLGAAESTMIWKASKENLIRRSTSQNFMDRDNSDTGNPEKAFSSQLKGIGHSQLG